MCRELITRRLVSQSVSPILSVWRGMNKVRQYAKPWRVEMVTINLSSPPVLTSSTTQSILSRRRLLWGIITKRHAGIVQATPWRWVFFYFACLTLSLFLLRTRNSLKNKYWIHWVWWNHDFCWLLFLEASIRKTYQSGDFYGRPPGANLALTPLPLTPPQYEPRFKNRRNLISLARRYKVLAVESRAA